MALYRQCPLDPLLMLPANDFHCFIMEIELHAIALNGDCPHPPLKDLIFKGALEGSTPLIVACQYGNFDSVERIIEHWGADVNKAAVYLTGPRECHLRQQYSIKLERATPLFVAASNGHAKIVRYLVEKGADVSARTHSIDWKHFDGLTPLYGVDCKLRFDGEKNNLIYQKRMKEESAGIVRFLLESGADALSPSSRPSDGSLIWTKDMCRADVITELINHGMDLNQRDQSKNRTLLHYWAGNTEDQEESVTIVELLIEKGADMLALDGLGFTPLLEAVIGRTGKCPNVKVLDFLLEKANYSQKEKIEAMELAGAVILSNEKNASQFHKAFDYWRRALQLRQINIDGSDVIQKTRLNLKSVRTTEWITSAELEDVIEHPETYMIQSFLVRLRIFSSRNWEAIELLIVFFLPDKFYNELRQQNRFIEMFYIIWAMLEMICCFDPSVNTLEWITFGMVRKLVRLLSSLLKESPDICNAEIIETWIS